MDDGSLGAPEFPAPDLVLVERTLQRLFGPQAVICAARPHVSNDDLFPEERRHSGGWATKRQAEFATARILARRALLQLGISAMPLLPNSDRSPWWPEGIIGSISHTQDLCAVAVANTKDLAGLGLDIECDVPLESGLVSLVCTDTEIRWIASQPPACQARLAKLIFSAKEAVYKCQYPVTGYWLDFLDVAIEIDLDARRFTAVWLSPQGAAGPALPYVTGGFEMAAGHWLCGARLG